MMLWTADNRRSDTLIIRYPPDYSMLWTADNRRSDTLPPGDGDVPLRCGLRTTAAQIHFRTSRSVPVTLWTADNRRSDTLASVPAVPV